MKERRNMGHGHVFNDCDAADSNSHRIYIHNMRITADKHSYTEREREKENDATRKSIVGHSKRIIGTIPTSSSYCQHYCFPVGGIKFNLFGQSQKTRDSYITEQ